ncbi:MAG: hypothetical protein VX798_13565 [Bacteroidota bacterium]|uniref:Lipocalin-like domain-containing protein n=1 Tax=Flagellimonas profundi TaxID=2915620 RepID=A0ABS3FJX7_9FLAO|nr:hypothetical protein [Allomuricauda profundi]MBO0343343.1 hypothetical protein [Allomuricauda profundi]MEC7772211.1 hypothetical protein [Bacteroidota bacterium]
MKKLMNNILRAALVVLVFSLSACQEEYEEVGGGSESETIAANSTTAVLIENTSSSDGSYDNIIDGASCFAVQFPYTVTVNGVDVTIDSESDLEVVEEIFDELEDDDDILDIAFPITITLSDFSEISIENQDELEALASECLEGGDDDDIECIDFVYPITLFTFGVDNQQANEVQVMSDQELRRFFDELEDDDLISIEFPITLKKYDGTEVTVQNNAELAAALEMAKNQCDEDDDDDYNDDDFTEGQLDEFLVACPLQVRQVIRDEIDNSEQYFEQLMTFNEDGTVVLSNYTGASVSGTWSTSMTDNGALLSLEFEALVDFSLEWYVYQLEEGVIKLYKDGGNRIILKKRCDVDPSEQIDREAFMALLNECEWVVKKVKNQGAEIERLLGYEFQFMTDGVVTLGNGVSTIEGTWEIGLNSQFQLSLIINMGEEPGVSFEWPIREMLETRLKFKIEETDHEMVLVRVCDDSANDGDVTEIRNIAMGGPWNVALYQEGEVDMTASYAGMDFDFSTMYQIEVSVNADPIANGLWRVLRDSDEGLKFYINFDTGDDLADLTDDWQIVSVTATRIELKDVSDDGSVDTLVFEKP